MRLFLIMPYSNDPGSTNRDIGRSRSQGPLPNGLTGIGVKLLLEVGPQHTTVRTAAARQIIFGRTEQSRTKKKRRRDFARRLLFAFGVRNFLILCFQLSEFGVLEPT